PEHGLAARQQVGAERHRLASVTVRQRLQVVERRRIARLGIDVLLRRRKGLEQVARRGEADYRHRRPQLILIKAPLSEISGDSIWIEAGVMVILLAPHSNLISTPALSSSIIAMSTLRLPLSTLSLSSPILIETCRDGMPVGVSNFSPISHVSACLTLTL